MTSLVFFQSSAPISSVAAHRLQGVFSAPASGRSAQINAISLPSIFFWVRTATKPAYPTHLTVSCVPARRGHIDADDDSALSLSANGYLSRMTQTADSGLSGPRDREAERVTPFSPRLVAIIAGKILVSYGACLIFCLDTVKPKSGLTPFKSGRR